MSLAGIPFTYVYDPTGERIRVVQFRGAGLISPSGLFFAPDGPGFVRLTVTDATGAADSVVVRLQ